MGTITLDDGRSFTVDDSFGKLPAEQQNFLVGELKLKLAHDVAGQMSGGMDKLIKPDYSKMTLGQQGKELVKNIPGSAEEFAGDLVKPFEHPVETAQNVANVGRGVLQKLGILHGEDSKPYADAVGRYLLNRYGGREALRKTLIEDPVGVAADLSVVFTGGGSILEKLGRFSGVAGTVGKVASGAAKVGKVMKAVDPTGKAVELGMKGAGAVAREGLGITTGTSGETIRQAFQAGKEGGEGDQAFVEAMRGHTSADQVVDEARSAVSSLKIERGNIYRSNKAEWGANNKVLDFDKVDKALQKIVDVKNFKGQDIQPKTAAVRKEIFDTVGEWRQLPANEFHTAEGLDALKQKIGDIRDNTERGTPSRYVADEVYQSIRKTIAEQEPRYAQAMKGYEEATRTIKEIERTLSLNPNASVDTALRKIVSVLRNNVNTNYGKRAELIGFLVRNGAPHLLKRIAGMSLNAKAPRGLSRLATQEGLTAAAGMLAGGNAGAAAGVLGMAPLSSPRLVGEAARGFGKVMRRVKKPYELVHKTTHATRQAGRGGSNP